MSGVQSKTALAQGLDIDALRREQAGAGIDAETVEEAVVETEIPAAAPEVESQVDSEVRAWLDRNLPEMVERVVREEVERMLRRLKDD